MVYVGAGISVAKPTSLPTGARLATAIHARLKSAFVSISALDPWDLIGIADTIAAMPGGTEAVRLASADSANFRTAKPGYAHKVLAHLMLEGVIDVLTTNWDDCIERGSGDERLPSVTNAQALKHVTPPWVLKIHGCASEPDSLLITSDHLNDPPTWVKDQTRARLGSAVVVFIGIGDVAGYVKQRIEEAIAEVGSVDDIRVVSPDIQSNWDSSQWKVVAPALAIEHRIPETADLFMEQIASAYITDVLNNHMLGLSSDLALSSDLDAAITGLCKSDSLRVLQWIRGVDINPRPGESVLRTPELGKALIALGRLAGSSARLNHSNIIETNDGPVELLISTQTVPPRALMEAAEIRLQDRLHRGESRPKFLVAGGMGPMFRDEKLPNDLVSDTSADDVIGGPLSSVPDVCHADEVLAS